MRFLEDSKSKGIAPLRFDGSSDLELVPTEAVARVRTLVSGNAVVVFSISGCCLCHVVKRLLFGLGVGPAVYELDQQKEGKEMQAVLCHLVGHGQQQQVPAVFVGGKLVGGLETVMTLHINGTFVPLLKEAGALWL